MSRKNPGNWTCFLYLLCGIVLGSFIGYYLGDVPYLSWLKFGKHFSLTPGFDLSILSFYLSIGIDLNIAGIIGLFLGLLAYRKL